MQLFKNLAHLFKLVDVQVQFRKYRELQTEDHFDAFLALYQLSLIGLELGDELVSIWPAFLE